MRTCRRDKVVTKNDACSYIYVRSRETPSDRPLRCKCCVKHGIRDATDPADQGGAGRALLRIASRHCCSSKSPRGSVTVGAFQSQREATPGSTEPEPAKRPEQDALCETNKAGSARSDPQPGYKYADGATARTSRKHLGRCRAGPAVGTSALPRCDGPGVDGACGWPIRRRLGR